MNNENINVIDKNPDKVNVDNNDQEPIIKKAQVIYKKSQTPLILQIVFASFALIFGPVIISLLSKSVSLETKWELSYFLIGFNIFLIIILTIMTIVGPIICIILSAIALKKQTEQLIYIAGIFGLFFGGGIVGWMTIKSVRP